ncbi:polysaccharide deacetylase [Chthoniobacter flavus Ellin428]|uniref:Polysaccharide deacetylase n=2 Tax=Chthoniobacter flavus TaxID=191863 RepID=B4CZX6_9BACT|nr:polysaccharide deacetylase family protein [Chthoniobacter flavus]EDY20290.1 polysaccharide deacetylase [Chthoniobacter flavus Ellin428]TCO94187.1 polysaccharide deacetylase [Chthoniobacter flavus]
MTARGLRDSAMQAAATLARPVLGGLGFIVTLHRVVPEAERSPLPSNRALEVTPKDLRAMLEYVRQNGLEIVAQEAIPARLASPHGPRFVCFTFDDGYRDNATLALPIFREFGAPFTVNITNGFIAGNASVWWYWIEEILNAGKALQFSWKGTPHHFTAATTGERDRALEEIARLVRGLGAERDALLRVIGEAAGLDPCALTRKLCLTWEELRALAADPLVTIGAHTAGHHSLNRLTDEELVVEVDGARRALAAQLGREVRHFAYPFGGAKAVSEREFALVRSSGFATMLTTRPGNLTREHSAQMDRLPRLTISGNYPALKELRMAESGLAAWRERRRGRA